MNPAAAAALRTAPVLLIHGEDDVETSPDHARRIFAAEQRFNPEGRLMLIIAATLLHFAVTQAALVDTPRFRYVLPDDFNSWACVDFGVEGAPPLKRDEGLYVVEPTNGSILQTSSLPNLTTPPVVSEVLQISSGSVRKVEVRERQQRSGYDTTNPVSRHCMFFGPEAAAAAVPRPPTLTESRLGIVPVLQHFELIDGNLCEFHDAARVCLSVTNNSRRIRDTIVRSVGAGVTVTTGKCDGFDGIVVRYRPDRAEQTHSSSPGQLYASAEVRRDRPRAATGLVTWMSGQDGSAEAIAERFGRDLSDFLKQVGSMNCRK